LEPSSVEILFEMAGIETVEVPSVQVVLQRCSTVEVVQITGIEILFVATGVELAILLGKCAGGGEDKKSGCFNGRHGIIGWVGFDSFCAAKPFYL
jgi:hypothetical protein